MREKEFWKLLQDPAFLSEKITSYQQKHDIIQCNVSKHEVEGHILKSLHNLAFAQQTNKQFSDWILVGCYYAAYHAALALLLSRGLSSKNHDATLCLLIREFYKQELNEEELRYLNGFDADEILFYVQARTHRQSASYGSSLVFSSSLVNETKIRTKLFVLKAQQLLR